LIKYLSLTSNTSKDQDKTSEKCEKENESNSSKLKKEAQCNSFNDGQNFISAIDKDVQAATFLDVAVIRCLFIRQWQEEGIFWALQFLYNR
jgi:pterin-4a-carbinolamine dehydratase